MAKSSDDRLSLFLSKRCLRGRVVMFAVTLRLTLFTLKPTVFRALAAYWVRIYEKYCIQYV